MGYNRVATKEELMQTKTYSVPGMHCGHCKAAVMRELEGVSGLQSVEVDLETKLVTIGGDSLDEVALVETIDEAGYEADRMPSR
jgi:copper chaperone